MFKDDRRKPSLWLLIGSISLFFGLKVHIVYGNGEDASNTLSLHQSTTYCGTYCLYAAMRMSGKRLDFGELVKPEYIGSTGGSSLAELKKAALDHGMYAQPLGNLSGRVLRTCRSPVILHVKPSIDASRYNHYVLFLGTQNGKARIFNPPNPIKPMSFSELAALWDGNGIILSSQPIDLAKVFAPARNGFILLAFCIIGLVLLIHCIRRFIPMGLFQSRRAFFVVSLVQGAGLMMVTLILGLLYHFVCDMGLLANAKVIEVIQQVHAGNFLPKVNESEVRRLLGSDTFFVDARLGQDYQAGHLNGAFNIPVDANDTQRQRITASIPMDSKIVVYCQSKGCRFADKVALQLINDGYSNIAIYRGGWSDWVAKKGHMTKDDRS